MIEKATVSCSEPPRNVAYPLSIDSATPKPSPPTTAPLMLSRPPNSAAAEAKIRIGEERAEVELVRRQHRDQQHAGERADAPTRCPS